MMYTLNGPSKDSYNDIGTLNRVAINESKMVVKGEDKITIEVEPHSVNVLVLS
jgi:hypothetical protein